jgi:hypothetical protein
MLIYGDFDVSDFWLDDEYAREKYIGEPLTDELLASIELELGYKLPTSYAELMKTQNGGLLARTAYRTENQTIRVQGIYGINRSKTYSLGGIWKQTKARTLRNADTGEPIHVEARTYRTGSRFYIDDRGYPPIGVYFADTISAGHDMICLDYRACGPGGEPQIVHVDQECDYDIEVLAPNFEMFVRGLK